MRKKSNRKLWNLITLILGIMLMVSAVTIEGNFLVRVISFFIGVLLGRFSVFFMEGVVEKRDRFE